MLAGDVPGSAEPDAQLPGSVEYDHPVTKPVGASVRSHRASNPEVVPELEEEDDRSTSDGKPADEAAHTVPNTEVVNLPDELKAKIVDPRSFRDIPIIDLRADETTVLSQMQYACEVVGFMQIIGHGVSLELQERHMRMQKLFFSLPEEVKVRLALRDDCPVRGYFGKGSEDLDQVLKKQVDSANGEKVKQQSRKDNKEALDMNGVPWSKPSGGFVAQIFGMPSQVPAEEELPGFSEVMEEYASEMFKLAKRLLSIMALVLGKPRDFFEPHLTAPVATHRLLHYWPIKDWSREIGVGEHTDYGLLTILKQDDVGGLHVLNAKDGQWVYAHPIDNAFVVNLGDMMGRWTAHRFKSTVHRVVNASSRERYSVPFFLEPNLDTVIVHGEICDGGLGRGEQLGEHARRCRLRRLWKDSRANRKSSATAEEILERFYRASGQLKVKVASPSCEL